jgi:rhodanese-related sulfurtransferase
MRSAVFALCLGALVALILRFIPPLPPSLTLITISDLQQRLQNGDAVFVIDVRSPEEFLGELGHIPGALNMPLEDLRAKALTINAIDRDRPVFLICRTDRRSSEAAQQFMDLGFSQVMVVKGGMVEWNEHQ